MKTKNKIIEQGLDNNNQFYLVLDSKIKVIEPIKLDEFGNPLEYKEIERNEIFYPWFFCPGNNVGRTLYRDLTTGEAFITLHKTEIK